MRIPTFGVYSTARYEGMSPVQAAIAGVAWGLAYNGSGGVACLIFGALYAIASSGKSIDV